VFLIHILKALDRFYFVNIFFLLFIDVDVNYDLSFYHPQGYGFAWIPYYIQVTNVNYISVTLWVRYSTSGDTGVYMTQFVGYGFAFTFRTKVIVGYGFAFTFGTKVMVAATVVTS
jgi:hypothetical protein